MKWLDGITDLDGHEFKQAPGVGDGQGSLVCYSPWGPKELDTTEQWNLTELKHNNDLINADWMSELTEESFDEV